MLVEGLLLFSSDTSLEYIYQSDKMSTLCQNIFINHDKISTLRWNIFINHDKMSTICRNIFISYDKMPTLCQNIFFNHDKISTLRRNIFINHDKNVDTSSEYLSIMIKCGHFVGIYLLIMIKSRRFSSKQKSLEDNFS